MSSRGQVPRQIEQILEAVGNLRVQVARIEQSLADDAKTRCSAPNMCLELKKELQPLKAAFEQGKGMLTMGHVLVGAMLAIGGGAFTVFAEWLFRTTLFTK